MRFGWINLVGAVIVVIMLVPNVIYAIGHKGEKNLCKSRLVNIAEQVARYACMIFMWLPLLVGEFGFKSEAAFVTYAMGNAVLLAAYIAAFALYAHKKTAARAIAAAALPACIFLLSGLTLRHPLLIKFAVIFAVTHLFVTVANVKARKEDK